MQYIFLKLNPLLYLTKSNISLQLHEKPPVNSLPHPSKKFSKSIFFFYILLISICRRVTINVILLIIIIIPPNALNSSHYLLRRLESLPYTSISLSSPPPMFVLLLFSCTHRLQYISAKWSSFPVHSWTAWDSSISFSSKWYFPSCSSFCPHAHTACTTSHQSSRVKKKKKTANVGKLSHL